jgi:prepilin-type processing-associated H-X9-DG protein
MKRRSGIRRPSKAIDFGEANNEVKIETYSINASAILAPLDNSVSSSLLFPHRAAGNFSHVDGHVESIAFNTMKNSTEDSWSFYGSRMTKLDQ